MTHLTGWAGETIEKYSYDAYGAPTTTYTGGVFNNRFKFTGREYATSFGVYEYRNRAYHPGLGRFVSEDPLGFAAGDYNLFRYCGNDPINRTDPMGLISPSVDSWQRLILWQSGSPWAVSQIMAAINQQQKDSAGNESQVGQSGKDSDGREWRGLTKNEAKLAHSSFGNAVDPDPVTLVHGRYLPVSRPHTVGNRIFFPKGYPRDFARLPAAQNSVLIHELTHVWQYQTRFAGLAGLGQMAIARTIRPSYQYLPFTGGNFSSYGIEQQAQIHQDAYLLSQGEQPTEITRNSGHPIPSLSEYQALLPFNH